MQTELDFCQKHLDQKIKYFCFNKFCQIELKCLCEICFIEAEHQECLQNQQIISKKLFTEKINEKLTDFTNENQELELLNKCANRFSQICIKFRQKVKQNIEGSYYLNQFLKRFQMFQSSDSLKEILLNQNFSDNQQFEQDFLQPTFEIQEELQNILNKMIEISENRLGNNHQYQQGPDEINSKKRNEESQEQRQNQTLEPRVQKIQEVGKQERKIIRIIISNKQNIQNKTLPQNHEQINKQEFKFNKQNEKLNAFAQQISENLEVGEIKQQVQNSMIQEINPKQTINENKLISSFYNQLIKLGEIIIMKEPIKCIKALDDNFLLITTKFQLRLIEINFQGEEITSNTQTLFTSNQQIVNFQISNNECIFQTQDLRLHVINIKTKQIKKLIKATSKHYCYTSRKIQASYIFLEQKQLYIFHPNKKMLQKYILTGQELVMEQQQTINEPDTMISMTLQGEFVQFSFANGKVQLYNINDLQLHSKFDLGLDSSAIDIIVTDKYIFILDGNKIIIQNKKQEIIQKFRINHNIRQYSHCAIQEKQLVLCFIAQSGAFNIFTIDLNETEMANSESKTLRIPYQPEHHLSKNKNSVLFFSTAFHQNQQNELLLFLGSSIGSIFIYKIKNSNSKQ